MHTNNHKILYKLRKKIFVSMDGDNETVNKRKQTILDSIQVFDFKNALEQSTVINFIANFK
jgi:hypothetical protein